MNRSGSQGLCACGARFDSATDRIAPRMMAAPNALADELRSPRKIAAPSAPKTLSALTITAAWLAGVKRRATVWMPKAIAVEIGQR